MFVDILFQFGSWSHYPHFTSLSCLAWNVPCRAGSPAHRGLSASASWELGLKTCTTTTIWCHLSSKTSIYKGKMVPCYLGSLENYLSSSIGLWLLWIQFSQPKEPYGCNCSEIGLGCAHTREYQTWLLVISRQQMYWIIFYGNCS